MKHNRINRNDMMTQLWLVIINTRSTELPNLSKSNNVEVVGNNTSDMSVFRDLYYLIFMLEFTFEYDGVIAVNFTGALDSIREDVIDTSFPLVINQFCFGMQNVKKDDYFCALLMLIIILVFFNVYFCVTETARDINKNTTGTDSGTAVQTTVHGSVYLLMILDNITHFIIQLMAFVLFLCKIADKVQTWISTNSFSLIFTKCLFWTVVEVVDQSWFIMAEVQTIYLIAVIYYPSFIGIPTPKGGKAIPIDTTKEAYRNAT